MHIKYCYLLKLIWHAINIKGWLQGEMQQHTTAAVRRQQAGAMCSCLCWGKWLRPQARARRTPERLPQHHSTQHMHCRTAAWGWLRGCKALLIFLRSYLQLTLHLGWLHGPWRVCALVCSADEKTDEAKIQPNLRSLPLPVVLGG